jgi:hypothetical protein
MWWARSCALGYQISVKWIFVKWILRKADQQKKFCYTRYNWSEVSYDGQYTCRQETRIVSVNWKLDFILLEMGILPPEVTNAAACSGVLQRSFVCLKATVPYASIWIHTASFYRLASIIVRTAWTVRKICCVARSAIEFDYFSVTDVPQGCLLWYRIISATLVL